MEKINMVTEERIIFNDYKIILKRQKYDKEKDTFSIKVNDDAEVQFTNRKTDWNGILGDFLEFVDYYKRDKIVLAHCEDFWGIEAREELDRVYNSYAKLADAITEAFAYNVCTALNFAEEYINQ
jgi:hypothetical protein